MKHFAVAGLLLCSFTALAIPGSSHAQGSAGLAGTIKAGSLKQPDDTLKKLSIEELMDIQVTLVSKRPEKLTEAAAAIQVVTNDDIHRSGATLLPEALRLAPNLHVGQSDARDWGISARGFNGPSIAITGLADKLLVMIDGRSVYTPLFGGVFWDVQNVMMEDISRIEVVSGPGGTLWGANAVNGVINIVSKSAEETQGLFASATSGTWLPHIASVRYGGKNGEHFFYRVYGQTFAHKSTLYKNNYAQDEWSMNQGGFRTDYSPSETSTLTIQGDVYQGSEGLPTTAYIDGQNIMGRWTRTLSPESDVRVQLYVDRTWRKFPTTHFNEDAKTYDVDFQHRFPFIARQSITWGANYRLMRNDVNNIASLSFLPPTRTMQLFSGFVQNEITLVPEKLRLVLGTKLEHNEFSGFGMETQPSARLAWNPASRQTVWASASRAIRAPARFDTDIKTPLLLGQRSFKSEKVVAYELGYRTQPFDRLSLSISTFYNQYRDLRSINSNPSSPPVFIFANGFRGQSRGVELSWNLQAMNWWRVRGGYTYVSKDLRTAIPGVIANGDVFEGNDPLDYALIQSVMDLPKHFQLDLVGRQVAETRVPYVHRYLTYDARLAREFKNMEFAIVGQNLRDNRHPEFTFLEIPRNVYGKLSIRY